MDDMKTDNIGFGQPKNTTIIEIKVTSPPRFVNVFFITFIVISSIIPIIIFLAAKSMQLPIGLGFLISLVVFVASITYLVRLYLWNTYGKEYFLIENNTILFYNDYKYFKDNVVQIKFNKISFGFILSKNGTFYDMKNLPDRDEECRFTILIDDKKHLESDILTRLSFLKKIDDV